MCYRSGETSADSFTLGPCNYIPPEQKLCCLFILAYPADTNRQSIYALSFSFQFIEFSKTTHGWRSEQTRHFEAFLLSNVTILGKSTLYEYNISTAFYTSGALTEIL